MLHLLNELWKTQGARKAQERLKRRTGNLEMFQFETFGFKNVFNLAVSGVNILNNLLKVENSDIPGKRIMVATVL